MVYIGSFRVSWVMHLIAGHMRTWGSIYGLDLHAAYNETWNIYHVSVYSVINSDWVKYIWQRSIKRIRPIWRCGLVCPYAWREKNNIYIFKAETERANAYAAEISVPSRRLWLPYRFRLERLETHQKKKGREKIAGIHCVHRWYLVLEKACFSISKWILILETIIKKNLGL